MIKPYANTKHSYLVMKLDHLLDKYMDYETITLDELYDYITLFRLLPKHKQELYAHLIDIAADLWDATEQPTE